jgi:hypothetical protein
MRKCGTLLATVFVLHRIELRADMSKKRILAEVSIHEDEERPEEFLHTRFEVTTTEPINGNWLQGMIQDALDEED